MKRYQVYLDPHSVAVLDDFETETHVSRSKLIREAIDSLADNLAKIIGSKSSGSLSRNNLDSLVGLISTKSNGVTNYAVKEDRSYLND